MVPGVVPVALLVARTDTHAVLVDGLLVYPTGFDFDLAVRRRPGHPRQHRRPHLWDDLLRLEVPPPAAWLVPDATLADPEELFPADLPACWGCWATPTCTCKTRSRSPCTRP